MYISYLGKHLYFNPNHDIFVPKPKQTVKNSQNIIIHM